MGLLPGIVTSLRYQCTHQLVVPHRPSVLWGISIGSHSLVGFLLFESIQDLCVCHLEDSVCGVTGGLSGCVCVQLVKPGIEGIEAVWKGGVSGVCSCCGSPVVCDSLNSLPHAASVVVEVVAFKLFWVVCYSDGLLQFVAGSLILHLISYIESLPPFSDFQFNVSIKPGFLVGEPTHSPGRGTNRRTPVYVAAHSLCVLVDG